MNSTGALRRGAALSLAVAGLFLALATLAAGSGQTAGRDGAPAGVVCNTIITGNISANTTWELSGGPYCIHAQVNVNPGVTLTIQPGVGVYFGAGTRLDVQGSLVAQGVAGQGILFSSESATPQPGDWTRLYVQASGTASLAYCEISYGGADGWGFRTDSSSVDLSHSYIHDNAGDGVMMHGGGISPAVSDTTIRANAGAGVYINGDGSSQALLESLAIEDNGGAAIYLATSMGGSYLAFPTFQGLALSGNGSDALNMQGGAVRFDLTIDSIAWLNGRPIVVVSSGLEPQDGHTLTLAPGTSLQFATAGGTLQASNGNAIVAEGTAALPVTIGPDPGRMAPGAWRGVKVGPGGHLRLDYCDVGYAGNDGTGVYILADDVQVRHCRVHHSAGDGIRLWGSGGFTALIEDTQVDSNAGAAVYENPETQVKVPTYSNLTFFGNGSDALNLYGTYLEVDRTLDGPGSFNGAPIVVLASLGTDSSTALTVTPGTTLKFDTPQSQFDGTIYAVGTAALPVTFTSNRDTPQAGDWSRMVPRMGSRLAFCEIGYAGGDYYPAALDISDFDVQVRNCWIHDSLTDGLSYAYYDWGYYGPETAHYENLALTDNEGAGLRVGWGSSSKIVHATLARNGGCGVCEGANATAAFTNTIVAGNLLGAYLEGDLKMDHTLWDGNGLKVETAGDGSFDEASSVDGPAGFEADGYHIGCTSVALNWGLDLIADDIDGQVRPWPPATPPDLGADESPCGQATEPEAQKVAVPPQWFVDPETGSGGFRQEYLIGYYYPGGQPLSVSVTDDLPAGLELVSQDTYPAMGFQQAGQQLAWQSVEPVPPDTMAVVHIDSRSTNLPPGTDVDNVAALDAGGYHFDLEASSTLPYVPPLLASPGDGETCKGRFPLRGSAQPGTTVKMLANYTIIGETTPDASGEFTYTVDYPSVEDWTVTARACVGAVCSGDSNAVVLTPQQSFWCPRQTVWSSLDGTRQFRNDNGLFSTVDPKLNLRWNAYEYPHQLTLAVGTWPLAAEGGAAEVVPPTQIWIETSDGAHWSPSETLFPPEFDYIEYVFVIQLPHQSSGSVCIHAIYNGTPYVSCIDMYLIDPDGTVFDVTQGFDPENPAATAIPGITVTCMISIPEWGGWVPWPAHLYNDQVNPQVTGADGYFSFFTPPGQYYLEVQGKQGYQDWRSPAIEVISQVVHVNVPLTPWPDGPASRVVVTPKGISPATVTVAAGDSVEWLSNLDDLGDLRRYTQNPVLRPQSDLDPQGSSLAWDGGMMAPGRIFRRQFLRPGSYTYADGAGHTGTVAVRRLLYLPLVMRND